MKNNNNIYKIAFIGVLTLALYKIVFIVYF